MPRINGTPATPGSVTPAAHDDEVANGAAPGASSRAPVPAQLAPYRPKREPVQNGAYRDQLRQGPMGAIGKLASPPKPQPATGDIQNFVPPNSSAGKGVFNAIRNALGSGQKSFTPLNLASKKPLTGVLGANSRAAGGGFAYDAHTAHEIPGMIASGASAVVAHQTSKRYQQKLAAMLQEDLLPFDGLPELPKKGINMTPVAPSKESNDDDATDTETQTQSDAGPPTPTESPVATTQRTDTNAPESAAHTRNRTLPTTPENMIVTRRRDQWQYDKPKLLRAANDPAHPQHQRARDVLAAMSIAENQGKRRKGALYESATSVTAATAGAVLAAGTHGAAAPLIVAGQSLNAVKDALDMKKFALETRQNLRDEKADDVQRHVTQLASGAPDFDHAPLEAQAGVYAKLYDNARRKTAQQNNFGYRLPGSLIDDRKAGLYKSAENDIVSEHIAEIAQRAMRRAHPETLGRLHEAGSEPNRTRAGREKAALEQIENDPQLRTTLTLLTDASMPGADAVKAMMKLSAEALKPAKEEAAEAEDLTAMSDDKKLEKIAGMIGEPGLKPADAAKDSKEAIEAALKLRS